MNQRLFAEMCAEFWNRSNRENDPMYKVMYRALFWAIFHAHYNRETHVA